MFDCDACEFRQQIDGLDAENDEAWRCYAKVTSHRWLWDMQGANWWLGRVFGELSHEDADELMDRIDVIYDALHPRQEKS